MGIEQSTQQSIYTPSALQIILLCVHAPTGLFRASFLPYSHVFVAEQLSLWPKFFLLFLLTLWKLVRPQTADRRPQTANRRPQTADRS